MVPLGEAENSRGGAVLGKMSLVLDIITFKLLGAHLGRSTQQQNCGRSGGGGWKRGERGCELFRKMAGMEANKRKRKVCKKNEFGKVV